VPEVLIVIKGMWDELTEVEFPVAYEEVHYPTDAVNEPFFDKHADSYDPVTIACFYMAMIIKGGDDYIPAENVYDDPDAAGLAELLKFCEN
jgi:hypothetical protein